MYETKNPDLLTTIAIIGLGVLQASAEKDKRDREDDRQARVDLVNQRLAIELKER